MRSVYSGRRYGDAGVNVRIPAARRLRTVTELRRPLQGSQRYIFHECHFAAPLTQFRSPHYRVCYRYRVRGVVSYPHRVEDTKLVSITAKL